MNFSTLYGDILAKCTINGAQMQYDKYSLLNTKFNILPDVTPSAGVYPINKILVIGSGGSISTSDAATGDTSIIDQNRRYTSAALYNHIPFIIRPLSNDLTPAQRALYALRVITTINTIQYVLYYGKRFSFAGAVMQKSLVSIVNGVSSNGTTFVPTAADLTPSIIDVTGSGLTAVQNTYLVTALPLDISLSASDLAEIYNACSILNNGNTTKANITEIGIASGVDHGISMSDGSTYNELIVAQLTAISTDIKTSITATSKAATLSINPGGMEPFVKTLSNASSASN